MKSSSREQQYVLLFQLELESRYTSNSSVALRPFEAWSYHSKNIPLSIVASTLFPLAYVACHRRDAWEEPLLRYALLLSPRRCRQHGDAQRVGAAAVCTEGSCDRKAELGCVLPMASWRSAPESRSRSIS